jgi:hypothetical protein
MGKLLAMMKLGAIAFAIAVPFFSVADGVLVFWARLIEGWGLVGEMWNCE